MRQPNSIQTQYFLESIRKVVQGEIAGQLLKTLAIVVSVDSNTEGYLVDVKYVNNSTGDEVLKGIPVLKNQYFNTPIYKDDLVMLLALDESLESYITKGTFTNSFEKQNYFAIPYTLYENFKHKNEFSLKTKEAKFKLTLNENDGLKVESQLSNKQKHKSLDVEIDSTLNMKIKQDAAIEANTSIELKTAAMSLGDAFEKLIDCFSNTPSMTTPSGGPVAEWPAIVAQLKAIKPLIKQSFK